jgi:ArsR family transcriptional regulator, arsenate/arsenite/antimonite-responsive transcriptional repressor / arsenate reductase (thioredoxin)
MTTDSTSDLAKRASIHAALADVGRLAIVDALLLADAAPSELQVRVSMPSNLLAHHLRVLERAGIVSRRRSEGDRRRTYLQLVPATLDAMVPSGSRHAARVVFVCTQNSARSQLAVAVWNRHSEIPAASGGIEPAPQVHPDAVAAAKRRGLRMRPHKPRRVDDVLSPGDLVIAVCDNAHEDLPPDTLRMHWSIPDPVPANLHAAFDRTVDDLDQRIRRLVPILDPTSNGAIA